MGHNKYMKLKIKYKDEVLTFETEKDSIGIGRSSDNDFVVPYEDFSRKHCLVTFKGDYAFITDLGSKNGVTIDGRKIPANQAYPIYTNSRVFIANLFEFILPDGTSIKEDLLDLTLDEPINRNR